MSSSSKDKITFALAHGAHHDETCWDKLTPKLEAMGYDAVAMRLPIDERVTSLDRYAEVIAGAVKNRKNVVVVGHSRMGKAIPRVPRLIPVVRQLVYLNAAVKPSKDQKELAPLAPANLTPEYVTGIIKHANGPFVEYDRSKAGIFCSDFDPNNPEIEASAEDIAAAIKKLRLQNCEDDAEAIDTQPDVPTAYILSTEDPIVTPDYSRFAARNYLNTVPIEIPGGHSPFLLRPTLLASILDSIVKGEQLNQPAGGSSLTL